MTIGYAFQGYDKENMARALGSSLPISAKHSEMVCNYIRGKSVERAKKMLEEVIAMEKAVPMTRHNFDRGHKTKIGPGRYPVKTCEEILMILKSAEKNAQQKNIADPVVLHICAQKAAKPWHYGRKRRRQMKRAHIEIVLAKALKEPVKKVKRTVKTVKKEEKKQT